MNCERTLTGSNRSGRRSRAFFAAVLCAALAHLRVADAGQNDSDLERLFNGNSFSNWVCHSGDRNAKLEDTWRIQPGETPEDAILVCVGKPFGYLRTVKEYENFRLSLEWRYASDPNANSGVLIHIQGADTIWPQSMQVQLHRPEAGSIFPEGGAVSDNVVRIKDVGLSVREWHRCVVTSRLGKLTVVLDDRKPAEVTGCRPSKGWIGLQSEGSEIHFRRIQLRRLK